MNCEFCAKPLSEAEHENLALLAHLRRNEACEKQFEFLIENLRASWTRAMSGG